MELNFYYRGEDLPEGTTVGKMTTIFFRPLQPPRLVQNISFKEKNKMAQELFFYSGEKFREVRLINGENLTVLRSQKEDGKVTLQGARNGEVIEIFLPDVFNGTGELFNGTRFQDKDLAKFLARFLDQETLL